MVSPIVILLLRFVSMIFFSDLLICLARFSSCSYNIAYSIECGITVLVILLHSRVAQGAYLEVEYIRNVLSVSGTLKYADSGTA